MLTHATSKNSPSNTTALRPWEWGPSKNNSTDPRSPEVLARVLDLVVARAGRPDDN